MDFKVDEIDYEYLSSISKFKNNNENQVISKTVEIKTHLVVRESTLKL